MKKLSDFNPISTLWIAYVVFIAFYLGSAWWPVSQEIKDAILGIMYLVPPAAAAIGVFGVALTRPGGERTYWLCIFFAIAATFAGEAYWIVRQITLGSANVPAISFANLAYLVGYTFFFISLIPLWRMSVKRFNAIHGFLVTPALMVLCAAALWYIQFASIYRVYYAHDQLESMATVIYAILDVALIVGLSATAFFNNAVRWPAWLASVIVGLIMFGFGDIAFTYFSIAGAYFPGSLMANLIDLLWMSCYIFILNGALLRRYVAEAAEKELGI